MKQTNDPLWCPPSALAECEDIPEILGDASPKVIVKGLVVEYGICKYKQRILAECIKNHESK